MTTREQLDSFHEFATGQLSNGGNNRTIDDLFDEWRLDHTSTAERAENVAAIQAAIDDMHGGDLGRDAGEIVAEVRQSLNGSIDS